MSELNSGTLGNITAQPVPQIGQVICVNLSVEACTRDRDVSEAGIEELRIDACVDVD